MNLYKKLESVYKNNLKEISHLDGGLRMEFSNYWFNIQPSSTEPIMRVVVEATNEATLAKEKKKVLDTIQKYL